MREATRHILRPSPLMQKMLAVNVGALLILVAGLLYTGQYERGLVVSESDALGAQAQIFAAALADAEEPRALARRLAVAGGLQVVVFDRAGRIVAEGGAEAEAGAEEALAGLAARLADALPLRLKLPAYAPPAAGGVRGYPGAEEALAGKARQDVWRGGGGGILLTAAAPVQDPDGAFGAVFLSRPGAGIDAAVREVRVAVLKIFVLALIVTVVLSVYLAETIVRPLMRLSAATERVRESILMKDTIPDLSARRDEIGDLSRAFREMTSALEARIDAISRFAADVAHEIKNPLASVKSAVETFAVVKDEGQREKLLSVIHHDVDRLNRLITDISNASRLDADLSRAEKKALDLAALLREAVAAEERRPGAAGKVALYLEEGRALPVLGNDIQLAQVVRNLVDNALSFVAEGGMVTVSAGVRDGRVFMHVDNPGPPIPEDRLETVFERFYSERPAGERFGLHSGLGLNISRQIVRMHRGEIFAQNLKDRSGAAKGVRFTVLLPIAK